MDKRPINDVPTLICCTGRVDRNLHKQTSPSAPPEIQNLLPTVVADVSQCTHNTLALCPQQIMSGLNKALCLFLFLSVDDCGGDLLLPIKQEKIRTIWSSQPTRTC